MKNIFNGGLIATLLTLLSCLLSPVKLGAQTGWIPDLLGPIVEDTVQINGNDTQHSLVTSGGQAGYAATIKQVLNSALENGDSWVRVGSVTDYGQGTYSLTFSFSRNTSSSPRSWFFSMGHERYTMVQGVATVPTLSVASTPEYIFPGEETLVTLTISNTIVGETYIVKDASGTIMATIAGTGSTVERSIILGEGNYTVQNVLSNPTFSVQEYEVFRNVPVFADTLAQISSSSLNPAALIIAGKMVGGSTVSFASSEDAETYLSPLLQWCNTCSNPGWKAGYEASYTYYSSLHTCGLLVTAKSKNLSEHDIPLVIDFTKGDNGFAPKVTFIHQGTSGVAIGATHSAIISTVYGDSPIRTINFYNGLGYEEQTVTPGGSGDENKDIIVRHDYDPRLRENRTWLPYAVTPQTGCYDASSQEHMVSFYHDSLAFSVSDAAYACNNTVYEASSLDRPRFSFLPGYSFKQTTHGTSVAYVNNSAEDCFMKMIVNAQGSLVVAYDGWAAGTLSGVKTTDGDGRTRTVYSDAEGHTVREDCVIDANTTASTLYAYDAFGRLAWVIQPEGADLLLSGDTYSINSDFAKNYCFVYVYDSRGRISGKRLPGSGWQEFVYDAADRPVMVRDGNLSIAYKWQTFQYDTFGRVIRKGLTATQPASLQTRAYLQSLFDGGISPECWSNPGTTLQEFVYDSYPSTLSNVLPFSAVEDVTSVNNASHMDPRTNGLLTWEKVYALDGDGYAERTYYYDAKGRIIRTATKHSDGGFNVLSLRYDNGNNIIRHHEVSNPDGFISGIHTLEKIYTYDNQGRVLNCTSVVDGVYEATVEYEYDNLGRLVSRCNITTTQEEIEETYSYTLQGWEKEHVATIGNASLYHSALAYETPVKNNTPCWTGIISSWLWEHAGAPSKIYTYSYDGMARLTGAEQYSLLGMTPENLFTERQISYDKNSNIISMQRHNGSNTSQTISYSYSGGNHRSGYLYDANGNVTKENTENLQVEYNLLNLPSSISVPGSGTVLAEYKYYSDGIKRSALDASSDGYLYDGSFRYNVTNENTFSLESVSYDGGRFISDAVSVLGERNRTKDGSLRGGRGEDDEEEEEEDDPGEGPSGFASIVFITDHLGSVRVVVGPDGTALQNNEFLPFGEFITTNVFNSELNNYLYTGKEAQLEFGVNLYDSQARFQSNTGAFLSQDPLAEKYYGISPYSYCAGNPVNLVDPEGRDIWELQRDGNIVWKKENTETYLVAVGRNGNRNGEAIKFKDETIVAQLSRFSNNGINMAEFEKSQQRSALQTFLFLSDNTDVEWAMHTVRDKIVVGTRHKENSAGFWTDYVMEKPEESIHSHPGITEDHEKSSMGLEPTGDKGAYRIWDNGSDWEKMDKAPDKLAPIYLIYFPLTKRTYRLYNDSLRKGVSKYFDIREKLK